ncbi:MAG: S8 family serine peptidase, partial [Bacteroidota bacterium]
QAEGEDVDFDELLDNDFVQLRFQADRGTVHAYAANNSGEAFFTDLSGIGADEFIEGTRVLGGNPNSTMGELGGTARSIISVGGYTTKNSFTNTTNEELSIEEVTGDYYIRTSRGPTLDGRLKPEISAPANLIASAESSFYTEFDPLVEVDQIAKGDGTHWSFSIRRGTSAAAPLVAGIAGLMLELEPDLDPAGILELMATHSEEDAFTGALPNQVWGHGKINAYGMIASMEQLTNTVSHQLTETIDIFPNPNKGQFVMRSDLTGKLHVSVFDLTGRSVFEKQLIKDESTLSLALPKNLQGMYVLKLRQDNRAFSTKLFINP